MAIYQGSRISNSCDVRQVGRVNDTHVEPAEQNRFIYIQSRKLASGWARTLSRVLIRLLT